MIWLDRLSAALLFLLGCVHNFVAAPMSFDSFGTPALWFVTGGITLWYAGIINFLWLRSGRDDRAAALYAALSNAVLVLFAISFVYVKQSWGDPQNALLIVPAVWLLARSLSAARAKQA